MTVIQKPTRTGNAAAKHTAGGSDVSLFVVAQPSGGRSISVFLVSSVFACLSPVIMQELT